MSENKDLKAGSVYAILAYLGWGFFPIYWKLLQHVPYLQILCHRVIWSFVFYTGILAFKEKSFSIYAPPDFKLTRNLTFGALVLMSNWLVYIYAVNSNQIVETSLGYFINPLVNILIGVLFLKEKLSRNQIIATVLAAVGVLIIAIAQGSAPWIAIFLAVSFSIYGLVKKMNPVSALNSNQYESVILVPFAILFLMSQSYDWMTPENKNISIMLLIGAGAATGLPLLFFSAAAKRIPYYLMGFFQFLAPTLQFLTGVVIFNEPLSKPKLIGFSFIWVAGILLILNSWYTSGLKRGNL